MEASRHSFVVRVHAISGSFRHDNHSGHVYHLARSGSLMVSSSMRAQACTIPGDMASISTVAGGSEGALVRSVL